MPSWNKSVTNLHGEGDVSRWEGGTKGDSSEQFVCTVHVLQYVRTERYVVWLRRKTILLSGMGRSSTCFIESTCRPQQFLSSLIIRESWCWNPSHLRTSDLLLVVLVYSVVKFLQWPACFTRKIQKFSALMWTSIHWKVVLAFEFPAGFILLFLKCFLCYQGYQLLYIHWRSINKIHTLKSPVVSSWQERKLVYEKQTKLFSSSLCISFLLFLIN